MKLHLFLLCIISRMQYHNGDACQTWHAQHLGADSCILWYGPRCQLMYDIFRLQMDEPCRQAKT